jgi:hypothetical protein
LAKQNLAELELQTVQRYDGNIIESHGFIDKKEEGKKQRLLFI